MYLDLQPSRLTNLLKDVNYIMYINIILVKGDMLFTLLYESIYLGNKSKKGKKSSLLPDRLSGRYHLLKRTGRI